MDVLDAGVFLEKWEARVPKGAKSVMWGPLQAKEMGFDGWELQDGGETGFVFHNAGVKLTMGRATSTLIFVRRLERAFLTVYFGGYPADAPAAQRRLDSQKVVGACEMFLSRIAKETVRFELMGEIALVDNVNDHAVRGGRAGPAKATLAAPADDGPAEHVPGAPSWVRVPKAGGRPSPAVIDADEATKARRVPTGGKGELWEV
jgi:hypothetical protein